MPKKAAKKKAAKTAARTTAGNITPKRTQGPHDGVPRPVPNIQREAADQPAAAAKPKAIDGYMNFPPPGARPAPKK